MLELIQVTKPDRWKIFQVLGVKGENDNETGLMMVSKEKIEFFCRVHQEMSPNIESDDEMKGFYAMIDPYGRFLAT